MPNKLRLMILATVAMLAVAPMASADAATSTTVSWVTDVTGVSASGYSGIALTPSYPTESWTWEMVTLNAPDCYFVPGGICSGTWSFTGSEGDSLQGTWSGPPTGPPPTYTATGGTGAFAGDQSAPTTEPLFPFLTNVEEIGANPGVFPGVFTIALTG